MTTRWPRGRAGIWGLSAIYCTFLTSRSAGPRAGQPSEGLRCRRRARGRRERAGAGGGENEHSDVQRVLAWSDQQVICRTSVGWAPSCGRGECWPVRRGLRLGRCPGSQSSCEMVILPRRGRSAVRGSGSPRAGLGPVDGPTRPGQDMPGHAWASAGRRGRCREEALVGVT